MSVTIRFDTSQVKALLNGLKADIPWVTSTTINNTLADAQQAQYEHMLQEFTIRNSAFLKYSVRINFAKKKANAYLGELFIADLGGKQTSDIWAKFEGGGTKTPTRGRHIAVPSDNAWPNRGRVKPQRNKPRNLDRSFVVKKGGETFIYQRKGKRTREDGAGYDQNVKLMYTLKTGVRIPDKLNFYKTTIPIIEKKLEPEFNRLLQSSIRRYAARA